LLCLFEKVAIFVILLQTLPYFKAIVGLVQFLLIILDEHRRGFFLFEIGFHHFLRSRTDILEPENLKVVELPMLMEMPNLVGIYNGKGQHHAKELERFW
jgi:hypothetical protein